ncbi:MAG TPA: hypothetical protein VE031_05480 [Chthoniobacterales bacterium]|nr:hypothetical protein [Chthoniobacterales bacterium]
MTGASKGIGAGIAKRFAAEGEPVVGTALGKIAEEGRTKNLQRLFAGMPTTQTPGIEENCYVCHYWNYRPRGRYCCSRSSDR